MDRNGRVALIRTKIPWLPEMVESREGEASQTVGHNEKGSLRERMDKELSSERLLDQRDRFELDCQRSRNGQGWKLSRLPILFQGECLP